MNNKATLKQSNTYSLTINGVEHNDFKLVSEWEGLAKLRNKQGVAIVMLPCESFLVTLFSNSTLESETKEVTIVKASPCFF